MPNNEQNRTKMKEKKPEIASVEEAMRKYAQLESEGKLPMDTEPFSPSISAEVLKRLHQKSQNTESK